MVEAARDEIHHRWSTKRPCSGAITQSQDSRSCHQSKNRETSPPSARNPRCSASEQDLPLAGHAAIARHGLQGMGREDDAMSNGSRQLIDRREQLDIGIEIHDGARGGLEEPPEDPRLHRRRQFREVVDPGHALKFACADAEIRERQAIEGFRAAGGDLQVVVEDEDLQPAAGMMRETECASTRACAK